MKRRFGFVISVMLLALSGALSLPAWAQNYRFSVPNVRVVVTVEKDAAVLIEYRIEFKNARGAHPIDVVDVGMPKHDYQILIAQIDGKPLHQWKPSEYIPIGPEVPLSSHAIPPGGTGVFEVRARIPNMVYSDTTDDAMASLRFTPTWFGSRYVQGETDLLLVVKFPKGVNPDDVVWHDDNKPFFQKGIMDPDEVAFVSWKDHYRFTKENMFGCSFPASAMDRVVKTTAWKLFLEWWKHSLAVRLWSAVIYLALFSLFFLLMTRATGWVLLAILDVILFFFALLDPITHLWAWLFMPAWAAVWYFGFHRRRKSYLPAMASIEGGRIHRGLTAPEAAVLLEKPLERVLAMILFEMIQKRVLWISRDDPFTVEATGTQEAKSVILLSDSTRVKLNLYEIVFWERIRDTVLPVAKIKFDKELKALITLVRGKMSGFDIEKTRDYYRDVVGQAWRAVKDEEPLEQKTDRADRLFGWLAMDDDYYQYLWHDRDWYYHPRWWSDRPTGPAEPVAPLDKAVYSEKGPSFKDVASSFAGRIEKASAACADAIDGFSARTGEVGKGIDLSGFDRWTIDTLSEMASSGGGGGCAGGGCACACAGCACACACAGGGR